MGEISDRMQQLGIDVLTTEQLIAKQSETVTENTEKTEVAATEAANTVVESVPTETATTEHTKQEKTEFDPAEYLKTITGGKFSSNDELKAALAELDNLPTYKQQIDEYKGKVVDDKELIEAWNYRKNGGNINDFLNIVKMDFADTVKVPNLEAIKMDMKLSYPELSDAQIAKKLERKYFTSEEWEDSEQREEALIELTVDAKAARQRLVDLQKTMVVPKAVAEKQQREADYSAAVKEWDKASKEASADFKEIKLGDEFTWKVEPQDAFAAVKDPTEFAAMIGNSDRYNGKDGYKQLLKDAYIAKNFEKMATAFAQDYHAKKLKAELADFKGTKTEPENKGFDTGAEQAEQTKSQLKKAWL